MASHISKVMPLATLALVLSLPAAAAENVSQETPAADACAKTVGAMGASMGHTSEVAPDGRPIRSSRVGRLILPVMARLEEWSSRRSPPTAGKAYRIRLTGRLRRFLDLGLEALGFRYGWPTRLRA